MQSRQSSEIVIRYYLTVLGLGYYVFHNYRNDELCDLIVLQYLYWVCSSHHSPNDMTSLSNDMNVHDRETFRSSIDPNELVA